MYKTILDIIITCNFLTSGFESGISNYTKYTEPSGVKASWTRESISKEHMNNNCVSLGLRAILMGIQNPNLVLVTAFQESKFATNVIGIEGKNIYYGLLQVAPRYTCPDLFGLPHGSWKTGSLRHLQFDCDPEESGMLYLKKLEKKYRKYKDKAAANIFCEYKKGSTCEKEQLISWGVQNRVSLLNKIKKNR